MCENDCSNPAAVDCAACKEAFCAECDVTIHRGGRKEHVRVPIANGVGPHHPLLPAYRLATKVARNE